MKSEFRRLMDEDREGAKALLSRLLKHKTTKEICELVGLASTRALYLIKKDLGLLRVKFAPTQEEIDTKTPRELAKEYGVSLQRVYGYLRERRKHGTELGSGDATPVDTNSRAGEARSEGLPEESTRGMPKR